MTFVAEHVPDHGQADPRIATARFQDGLTTPANQPPLCSASSTIPSAIRALWLRPG